ncbi:MAG: serine protease [Christensenellaceae bacterium]|jgi:S1-C subfamily serine protease|nr:serine protease [Christensenellaceae bacterium]
MKKFIGVFAVFILCSGSVLFSGCSIGGGTTELIIHTNNLKHGINLALRSSVIVQAINGNSLSAGSGVIYKIVGNDMYIITNWHVIAKSGDSNATPTGNYMVIPAGVPEMFQYDRNGDGDIADYNDYIFDTNPQYIAETNIGAEDDDSDNVVLVGGSSYYDIAILKVTNTSLMYTFNLKAAKIFGEDEETQFIFGRLAYGETVFAIGNALDDGISATEGIVSVPSEYTIALDLLPDPNTKGAWWEDYMPRRVIRTTAAVAQGNSGGGLFNGSGELVGIVQSKLFYYGETATIGGYNVITDEVLPVDNMAYAVPIDIAVRIAMQMVERDALKNDDDFAIGANKDCLTFPSVGISLDSTNKHSVIDGDGIVFYEEDILVAEIGEDNPETGAKGCQLELNPNDIIRRVECNGKVFVPTQTYQIREFLIECYDATEITIWVERENETDDTIQTDENGYYKITGGFAGMTDGRPNRTPPAAG